MTKTIAKISSLEGYKLFIVLWLFFKYFPRFDISQSIPNHFFHQFPSDDESLHSKLRSTKEPALHSIHRLRTIKLRNIVKDKINHKLKFHHRGGWNATKNCLLVWISNDWVDVVVVDVRTYVWVFSTLKPHQNIKLWTYELKT
jgi:hypothetical protein